MAVLDITPLTGTLGATIAGVDLRHELNEDTIAAIRAAFLRHREVVISRAFSFLAPASTARPLPTNLWMRTQGGTL